MAVSRVSVPTGSGRSETESRSSGLEVVSSKAVAWEGIIDDTTFEERIEMIGDVFAMSEVRQGVSLLQPG